MFTNKTADMEYLANVTMWEPPFNGSDAKAAAMQASADAMAADSASASDDENIAGVNAVVGMFSKIWNNVKNVVISNCVTISCNYRY